MHGFVYLLGNKAMPCYYKIGCTERSPHARAQQLATTGVPHPFDVMLYIEVNNFQQVERKFHRELSDFRASGGREFFCFGPVHMDWLWYLFDGYPDNLAFASPAWHKYSYRPQFPDGHVETWIDGGQYLCMPSSPPIEGVELRLVA